MAGSSSAGERVPFATRLAYGAPNFGLALIGVPILVYLPRFYSDVVGMPIMWIGVAFVAGRILDALTDPLVGYLSDRSRSAAGRRRPWIRWGCVPLALLSVALFIPPSGLTGTPAMVWAGLLMVGWFLAYTAINVPYRALGPELTDDYDERTALFSIREGLFVVGTLVAAVGPGAIGLALGLDDGEAERRRFAWYIAGAAPLFVVACFACTGTVRERFHQRTAAVATRESFPRQVRRAFRNRPFAILLSAFVVIAIGSSLPAVLISYFTTYVLHTELMPLFLLIYFGIGLACLPGWIALSRRWGKKRTWLTAMVINAGFFMFVAFLGDGDVLPYGLLVAGSGTGGVAVLALPYSMQADVIDHDEHETGERREGLYGGLWSIAEKSAAGLGLGVSMLVLDVAGYQPNQEQSAFVLDVLRVLYIGVPVVCTAAGFAIALRYPLDRAAHQAITAKLHRDSHD
ncbi:MAG: MFS transporter [Deltaproteobacteria bacterium]|nr:MFS transporter [Deltaproteobacteria bacterium]